MVGFLVVHESYLEGDSVFGESFENASYSGFDNWRVGFGFGPLFCTMPRWFALHGRWPGFFVGSLGRWLALGL